MLSIKKKITKEEFLSRFKVGGKVKSYIGIEEHDDYLRQSPKEFPVGFEFDEKFDIFEVNLERTISEVTTSNVRMKVSDGRKPNLILLPFDKHYEMTDGSVGIALHGLTTKNFMSLAVYKL